jgi:hypothetical protein
MIFFVIHKSKLLIFDDQSSTVTKYMNNTVDTSILQLIAKTKTEPKLLILLCFGL